MVKKALGLSLCILTFITVCTSKAKAEIKDTSWVTDSTVTVVENAKQLEAAEVGGKKAKLGYWGMSSESDHYIIPIKVSGKGKLIVAMAIRSDGIKGGDINFGLYRDKRLTKAGGNTGGLYGERNSLSAEYSVDK